MIQKILQIYLKYSESTSDLLDELACKVLPQVVEFGILKYFTEPSLLCIVLPEIP